MQSVIVVFNENYDFLCVANDFYSAIQYLIENDWITDDMQVFDWCGDKKPLKSSFPNYKEIIVNEWDMSIFNDFFRDSFRMERVNIFTRMRVKE